MKWKIMLFKMIVLSPNGTRYKTTQETNKRGEGHMLSLQIDARYRERHNYTSRILNQ